MAAFLSTSSWAKRRIPESKRHGPSSSRASGACP